VFDDGGEHAAYARALAAGLAAAGATARRVTLVGPRAPGGRSFEGDVEVLSCPALLDASPRAAAVLGRRLPIAGRLPSVQMWRSALALALADRVLVVGPATLLARSLLREQPRAVVIDPHALGVDAAVALALA